MRIRSSAFVHSLAWALFVFSPAIADADDGPTLYKQLCASCHEAGTDRAPNREALRSMTSERVLTAMEGGPMLSMAAGRTGVERRAIAEYVTGKPFAQAFSTTPSPQAMCKPGGRRVQPADRSALERVGREQLEHTLSGRGDGRTDRG